MPQADPARGSGKAAQETLSPEQAALLKEKAAELGMPLATLANEVIRMGRQEKRTARRKK